MKDLKKRPSGPANDPEGADANDCADSLNLTGEIIVNVDVMLAKRKMSVSELAERVGITLPNVSILKNGKAKAIKFTTLARLCEVLDCQPGDILEYRKR